MLRLFLACSAWLICQSLVLSCFGQCEHCGQILTNGVRDKINLATEDQLRVKLSEILELSREEIDKRKTEGGGKLNVLGLFDIGGGGSEEAFWHLHDMYKSNKNLAWDSGAYLDFCAEYANKAIVDAWKKCISDCSTVRTKGEIVGDGDSFIVVVRYVPQNESDPAFINVRSVNSIGATVQQPVNLKSDAKLTRFSSISQVFHRNIESPVEIVVDFDGSSPIILNLRAGVDPDPPTPPPPSIEEIEAALSRAKEAEYQKMLATHRLRVSMVRYRFWAFDGDNEEDISCKFEVKWDKEMFTFFELQHDDNNRDAEGKWQQVNTEKIVEAKTGEVNVVGSLGSDDYHRPHYGTQSRRIDYAAWRSGAVTISSEQNGGKWEAEFSVAFIPK